MLHVQEYLRSGKTLDELKATYAIGFRVNEELGVVCLNYSQFDSPMSEPIVRECRSLTLEIGSWDIMVWAFPRFFNYGEGNIPEDFDWENFQTTEKLDGSLITLWCHREAGWQISTRSVPDGNTQVDDTGLTFKELVFMALEDMGTSWEEVTRYLYPNSCYVCELLCEENQVVVHMNGRKLVLLAIRDLTTNTEIDAQVWKAEHSEFPLSVVHLYEKFSLEAVREFVQTRNPLEHEGFVLMDKNFNRIKLKSDAYCFMSHKRDGLGKSNRTRLKLVLSDAMDDIMPILPKFVQEKILDLQSRLNGLIDEITLVHEQLKGIETQKEFAGKALTYRFSAVLFVLRSGRLATARDWFLTAPIKNTLAWLKLEDDDEDAESSKCALSVFMNLFICNDCQTSIPVMSLLPVMYLNSKGCVEVSTYRCPKCRGEVEPKMSVAEITSLRTC